MNNYRFELDVMIPANRAIEVSSKASLDQVNNRRAILFQIGEADVPDGVQYAKSIDVKTRNK